MNNIQSSCFHCFIHLHERLPHCSPCLCFSKDFAFNWTEYSAGFNPKFVCKKATHSNQLIPESIKNNKRGWNEIISRALFHSQENRFIALAEKLSQAREMQVIILSPPGFSSCPQSKTMRISELISSLKTSLPCTESLQSTLPISAASFPSALPWDALQVPVKLSLALNGRNGEYCTKLKQTRCC